MESTELTATVHRAVRDTIEYLTAANSPAVEAYREHIATLRSIMNENAVAHDFARMFGIQLPKFWVDFQDAYKGNRKQDSCVLAYKKLRDMAKIATSGGIIIGLQSGATFEDSLTCQSFELGIARKVLMTQVEPTIFEGIFEAALKIPAMPESQMGQPRPVKYSTVIKGGIELAHLSCQLALLYGLNVRKLF